jgi:hypothetical protein
MVSKPETSFIVAWIWLENQTQYDLLQILRDVKLYFLHFLMKPADQKTLEMTFFIKGKECLQLLCVVQQRNTDLWVKKRIVQCEHSLGMKSDQKDFYICGDIINVLLGPKFKGTFSSTLVSTSTTPQLVWRLLHVILVNYIYDLQSPRFFDNWAVDKDIFFYLFCFSFFQWLCQ